MLFLQNGVTERVQSWGETVQQSFTNAFYQMGEHLSNIIGMVVVLVIGYFVAKLLDRAATSLSQSVGLDVAAERSGLAQSMRHVGIERGIPTVVGKMVFWVTLVVFITAAFKILGWAPLENATDRIVLYIPNLLVASVVVVVGLLIAGFLRGVVATSADRVGLSYASTLANAVYYVLALTTMMVAFDQLKIEIQILNYLVMIAFGGMALGLGLAFGLGGRDVMAGILAGYYTRQRLQPGDHVEVAGLQGTVREVGPVATVIETDEHGLVNRHSIPNTRMLNEAVR